MIQNDVAEDVFEKANDVGFMLLKRNFISLINQESKECHYKQIKQYSYKARDLRHELSLKDDDEIILRKIKSLTFDKMPAPYIMLEGKKIFLKLEGYDSGKLEKQQ